MIEMEFTQNEHVLYYDSYEIPFQIQYSHRKTLSISVTPDQSLEVVAPIGSDPTKVLNRVEKRKKWIVKQIKYFEQFKPQKPDPAFISGESFVYLGRQ